MWGVLPRSWAETAPISPLTSARSSSPLCAAPIALRVAGGTCPRIEPYSCLRSRPQKKYQNSLFRRQAGRKPGTSSKAFLDFGTNYWFRCSDWTMLQPFHMLGGAITLSASSTSALPVDWRPIYIHHIDRTSERRCPRAR